MNFSSTLYTSWQRFCAVELGRFVEINDIAPAMISHVVPAGKPPLRTSDGAVRKLSMTYDLEDLDHEFPN